MLSDQLIITIAGKKGSGKNTLGNFCVGYFLRKAKQIGDFRIEKNGTLSIRPNGHEDFTNIRNREFNPEIFGKSVKLYSFADPLKQFCIDTLGLTFEQCYGTDTEKNELTHCTKMIDDSCFFQHTEKATAREVMQIFGTEFVRSLWKDAWAFSTYKKIQDEGYNLAIITDARFPNEILMGKEQGAKLIKLLRNPYGDSDQHVSETALDDFDNSVFDIILENNNMTIEHQNEFFKPYMTKWCNEKN